MPVNDSPSLSGKQLAYFILRLYIFTSGWHRYVLHETIDHDRLCTVFQLQVYNLLKRCPDLFIVYRKTHLHAVVDVPVHPIRRAAIYHGIPSLWKMKIRPMFKVTIDDSANGNVFTIMPDPRYEPANAPDDQFNFNPGRRCIIQF